MSAQLEECFARMIFRRGLGLVTVACACACASASMSAQASVVIGGTRVIYPGSAREVTVRLNNVGRDPSLVQVWGDRGDASVLADEADAPFVIMPPIFRIEPAGSQALRMTYTREPLPQDKETVFWLNVLDIPPSPPSTGAGDANLMQIAVRTRIKIF